MFRNLFANVRAKSPLVHNITNYVTVNDCANIVLACRGGPPSWRMMPPRSRTSPRCVPG